MIPGADVIAGELLRAEGVTGDTEVNCLCSLFFFMTFLKETICFVDVEDSHFIFGQGVEDEVAGELSNDGPTKFINLAIFVFATQAFGEVMNSANAINDCVNHLISRNRIVSCDVVKNPVEILFNIGVLRENSARHVPLSLTALVLVA